MAAHIWGDAAGNQSTSRQLNRLTRGRRTHVPAPESRGGRQQPRSPVSTPCLRTAVATRLHYSFGRHTAPELSSALNMHNWRRTKTLNQRSTSSRFIDELFPAASFEPPRARRRFSGTFHFVVLRKRLFFFLFLHSGHAAAEHTADWLRVGQSWIHKFTRGGRVCGAHASPYSWEGPCDPAPRPSLGPIRSVRALWQRFWWKMRLEMICDLESHWSP